MLASCCTTQRSRVCQGVLHGRFPFRRGQEVADDDALAAVGSVGLQDQLLVLAANEFEQAADLAVGQRRAGPRRCASTGCAGETPGVRRS